MFQREADDTQGKKLTLRPWVINLLLRRDKMGTSIRNLGTCLAPMTRDVLVQLRCSSYALSATLRLVIIIAKQDMVSGIEAQPYPKIQAWS